MVQGVLELSVGTVKLVTHPSDATLLRFNVQQQTHQKLHVLINASQLAALTRANATAARPLTTMVVQQRNGQQGNVHTLQLQQQLLLSRLKLAQLLEVRRNLLFLLQLKLVQRESSSSSLSRASTMPPPPSPHVLPLHRCVSAPPRANEPRPVASVKRIVRSKGVDPVQVVVVATGNVSRSRPTHPSELPPKVPGH